MSERLKHYSNVPLTVEVELGRRTLKVQELLALAPGSVITLPNPVGSKMTVYVGGACFCMGEMMRRGKAAAFRISSFVETQGGS